MVNVDIIMMKIERTGKFIKEQMQEIRLGLEKELDVSIYAKPEFRYGQMQEIRLGLEKELDVSIYAKPDTLGVNQETKECLNKLNLF